jgi:hypothetical protein
MLRFRSAALAALALLISSTAWADLRTYDIDPQYQQEIFSALNNILNSSAPGVVNGASYGRVQLLPSGQLLVNAEPATLEQVDRVLQALRARPVAAAPRVQLQYWVVLGTRAGVANASAQSGVNVSVAGSRSPADLPAPPSALNEVLGELKRVHGDLQFRVLGSASLTTQSGQQGEVSGTALFVEQTAFVQNEMLNAEIDLRLQPAGGGVTVRTALRRGEFVVLGQSELADGGLDGPVFFIVHWPGPQGR